MISPHTTFSNHSLPDGVDSIDLMQYVTGELEDGRNAVFEDLLKERPELQDEVCEIGVTSMIIEDELRIKPGGLTDRQRRIILKTLDTVGDAAPVGRAVLTAGVPQLSARRWRQAFIASMAAVLVLGSLLVMSWFVPTSGYKRGFHAAMEDEISDLMAAAPDELSRDVLVRMSWIPEEALQSRYSVVGVRDGEGEGKAITRYAEDAYFGVVVASSIEGGGEVLSMGHEAVTDQESMLVAGGRKTTVGMSGFRLSAERAVSCVLVHRNTTGYDAMRHMIREQSRLPVESQVRIEDLINYFPYNYPSPPYHEQVGLTAELSECPWNPAHQLLRIGIKASGREGDSSIVAKDVGLLVDFNPARVEGYRLVGYARHHYDPEKGLAEASQDKMEHSLKAGQTVTAIYEVIPIGQSVDSSGSLPAGQVVRRRWVGLDAISSERGRMAVDDLLTVRMLYRVPGRIDYREKDLVINSRPKTWLQMDEDFRFAAAVAGYGLLLKDPASVSDLNFNRVVQMAMDGLGADVDGRRMEFIGLVKNAGLLSGESVDGVNQAMVPAAAR